LVGVEAVSAGFHQTYVLFSNGKVGVWGLKYFMPDMPMLKGDINGDGRIDISDVILCLRMAVGLSVIIGDVEYFAPEYSAQLLAIANINGDAGVDISDVIMILRKSVGLEI